MKSPHDPREVASGIGVQDILVFARTADGLRLTGGVGRGTGWAEIVEVRMADEPIAHTAWRSGIPVRTTEPIAVRVIGPYWARNSVTLPVGDEHLVVFGGQEPIDASDAALVSAAAGVVSGTQRVPAEKLLADELELVHAVRALTAYRAENVKDTARHIATVAARSLSCDVAAIRVQHGPDGALEVLRVGPASGTPTRDDDADRPASGPDAPRYMTDATGMIEPLVEQSVLPDPRVWTDDVVSRMTLPIGGDAPIGALSLGHAASRPRGFTLLCQRIGRALAEAAELLLSQAIAREQLDAEHELLRRFSVTDPLTGVGNRAAWDEAIREIQSSDGSETATGYAVISADLDELKEVNDRFGHAIGDAVLRGAASLLHANIRDGDVIARVGGDEFLLLLRDTDERGARRVAQRITRNLKFWRVSEHDLSPELSVGWAVSPPDGDPVAATHLADERMYVAKRRRSRARRSAPAGLQTRITRTARRRTDR